ncbi:hypothetical protein MHBO_001778 [Bonamia ostreae]|uniref:Uncharacterized protein n=1 Tax=Bonamia ostreae TaxID=126728 RepID=A0ABV2AK70_9EUKA
MKFCDLPPNSLTEDFKSNANCHLDSNNKFAGVCETISNSIFFVEFYNSRESSNSRLECNDSYNKNLYMRKKFINLPSCEGVVFNADSCEKRDNQFYKEGCKITFNENKVYSQNFSDNFVLNTKNVNNLCGSIYTSCNIPDNVDTGNDCITKNNMFIQTCQFSAQDSYAFKNGMDFKKTHELRCPFTSNNFILVEGCNTQFLGDKSLNSNDCTIIGLYIFGNCDLSYNHIQFQNENNKLEQYFKYRCSEGNDNSRDIVPVKGCPVSNTNEIKLHTCNIIDGYFYLECEFKLPKGYQYLNSNGEYKDRLNRKCSINGIQDKTDFVIEKGCVLPTLNIENKLLFGTDCFIKEGYYYRTCSVEAEENYLIKLDSSFVEMFELKCVKGIANLETIIVVHCFFVIKSL